MHYNAFHPADPNSILNFLSTFKTTSENCGVWEDAVMGLLHFFLWNPSKSISNTQACFRNSWSKLLEVTIFLDCTVVNYLLPTYASANVNTEETHDITSWAQPHKARLVPYAQTLCDISRRCCIIVDRAKLQEIFKEPLPEFIRSSLRHHSAWNKPPSLSKLASQAKSLRTSQARLGRAVQRKNKKAYAWSKLLPKSLYTVRPSLDITLSSSDSKIHTDDHAKAVFKLKNAIATPSTASTSNESSILDSVSYCCVCLQSSQVTLARSYIRNPTDLAKIQLKGLNDCSPLSLSTVEVHRNESWDVYASDDLLNGTRFIQASPLNDSTKVVKSEPAFLRRIMHQRRSLRQETDQQLPGNVFC